MDSEPTASATGLVRLRHVANRSASFGWGEHAPAVVLALAYVASRGGLVAALVARKVHHRRIRRPVVEAPQ